MYPRPLQHHLLLLPFPIHSPFRLRPYRPNPHHGRAYRGRESRLGLVQYLSQPRDLFLRLPFVDVAGRFGRGSGKNGVWA